MQNTISPVGEGVEGFAEPFKNRAVLPLSMSEYDDLHLMAHELAHISQFEILYGGFWRSPRLLKAMGGVVPLWVMEGQAEHVAHAVLEREWSSYDRMILRDAALYDYLYTLRELQNFSPLYRHVYLGYKISHYAIDYLTEVEGERVNFRLLRSLRNNLDPIKAFEVASTEFAGLHDFDRKMRNRIKEETRDFTQGRDSASDSGTEIIGGDYHCRTPVPDGEGGFYYVSDRWLRNEIYRHTPDGEKKVLKGFFGSKVDTLVSGHRYDRIIDYSPGSGLLAFIAGRNHRNYLCLHDTVSNDTVMVHLEDLHEPRSPALSPCGKKVIFTALKDAMRNIFVYETGSGSLRQVTSDRLVDYGPVFLDSGRILAATERNLSTDLRVIRTDEGTAEWLTDTPSLEIHPHISPEGEVYFISDPDGVFNIYRLSSGGGETPVRVTNLKGGAFGVSSYRDGVIASCYYDGSYRIVSFTLEAAASGKAAGSAETEPEVADPDNGSRDYAYELSEEEYRVYEARSPFSTDFFLPSFLYSTDIGFVGGGYYMGSDMLGVHNLSLYLWGWPGLYEWSAGYMFQKWRPDIFISVAGDGEEFKARDAAGDIHEFYETGYSVSAGLSYPLRRISAVSLWTRFASDKLRNETTGDLFRETETGAGVEYIRSTAVLKPFHTVRGSVFSLSAYAARPLETYGVDFNRYEASLRNYTPLTRHLTVASRAFAGRREGPDASLYSLDTSISSFAASRYRLRGYPRRAFRGQNIFSSNLELRWLVLDRLNRHIYFMWPDMNIYSASIRLFTDAGTAWDGDRFPEQSGMWGFSWGGGFQLNLYLLQLAPVYLSVDFSTPYDSSTWRSSVVFSSGYITW